MPAFTSRSFFHVTGFLFKLLTGFFWQCVTLFEKPMNRSLEKMKLKKDFAVCLACGLNRVSARVRRESWDESNKEE